MKTHEPPKFTVNDIIKLMKKRPKNKYSPVTTPVYKLSMNKVPKFSKENNELFRSKVVTTPNVLNSKSPLNASRCSHKKNIDDIDPLAMFFKYDRSSKIKSFVSINTLSNIG